MRAWTFQLNRLGSTPLLTHPHCVILGKHISVIGYGRIIIVPLWGSPGLMYEMLLAVCGLCQLPCEFCSYVIVSKQV